MLVLACSLSQAEFNSNYDSPSQGKLELAWTGPLIKNGTPATISDYPRYENLFAHAEFPAQSVTF